MIADKWNFKKNNYEPYDLPRGASLIGSNNEKIINCASCAKEIKAGDCRGSKRIDSNGGLGYMVCKSCYEKEIKEEQDARRMRRG